MRLKLQNKGVPFTVAYGVSGAREKSFKRAIVCIQEGNHIYKILSVTASKKDESLYAFFNYCKEKKASLVRHKHTYKGGLQRIEKAGITHEFEIDDAVKLSIHRSGFVQFSGKGTLSGTDVATGKPLGVGVISTPTDTPVESGPTFGFTCWGVSKGFEVLSKQKPGIQYIVLNRASGDFEERYIDKFIDTDFMKKFLRKYLLKNRLLNTYVLEFFIFPKEANKFIYEYRDKPFINHTIRRYIHKPGATFAHTILDICNFSGVIALFPAMQYTPAPNYHEFGFSIGGPGGANSISEQTKAGYNFHLYCAGNARSRFFNDIRRFIDRFFRFFLERKYKKKF